MIVKSIAGALSRQGYFRGSKEELKKEMQDDKTYLCIEVSTLPVKTQIAIALAFRDWGQQDLANHLNVSPSTVTKWLRGGVNIPDKYRYKIMAMVAGND